ncbi:MAG TPA: AMP-binding protein, partial [Solirubrobacteraceae bacterium]
MSTDVSYRYDPTRFREVFEHRFSYIGGIQRNSRRYGSRPALHDPATDRRWTYSELWRDSGRLAAGLSAAGIGSDDVVVFD